MPRMGAEVYAAHIDSVLKLARREGGVSRPEIISELNVTRAVANGLIEKADLVLDRKDGRTEYFAAPNGARSEETEVDKTEVKAVAEPANDSTGESIDVDSIEELDAQILDTRSALNEAAEKAGKALGQWAKNQALVDSMRARLQELATKRMRLSS